MEQSSCIRPFWLWVAGLLAASFACSGCAATSRLSPDAIRNAPYVIPGVGTVTFHQGSYDRAASDATALAPLHIGQIDLFSYGDLDGDGAEDAVTFLATSSGGPSIYLSMEAFLNRRGTPVHAGGIRIGDRVAIDSLAIENRVVNLHLITQGPEDSICCPTLHVSKQFVLRNGAFLELPGASK